jgi:hypothetical protein
MVHRFTGLAWLAVLVCALYWTVRLERADWLFVKGDAGSLRAAMRLAPGNAEYASALAVAEPARAVKILQEAAGRNPLDGGLRVQLGLAEEERGDFGGAEADLIEAERLDRGFAPRWALADFYFHRQEAEKFWPAVKSALDVSYGDVSAQFRQCWSLTGDADFILQRAIPDRPAVLRRYLDFLVSDGRLNAAARVALRVVARADREAAPSLENYCDRMLADWRGEEALAVWNGLVERKLIAESGHGFDWRIAEASGSHVERTGGGWILRFNGRQPESTEILSRYVPLVSGQRYRLSGCPVESGLECRLLVADGRDLLLASHGREGAGVAPQARASFAGSRSLALVVGHASACPGERRSPLDGFHGARQISPASQRRIFGHADEETPPAAATGWCRGGVADTTNGQAPGASFARLDKLKHVPQSTARELSAVSFQLSAFERYEIRSAGDVFQVPEDVNLGRLVLAYRRVPGTTRFEGSIVVRELAVEAADQ